MPLPPWLHLTAPSDVRARAFFTVGFLSACATVANLVLVSANPTLGFFTSPILSAVLALFGGALVTIAHRFPKLTLVTSSALFFVDGIAISLAAVALLAGGARNFRADRLILCLGCASAVAFTPWLPETARLAASALILFPFVLGSALRTTFTARELRTEQGALDERATHLMQQRAAFDERVRIAGELHDHLGHLLTSAEIHARLLRDLPPPLEPESQYRVALVHTQLRRALDTLADFVRESVSLLPHASPDRDSAMLPTQNWAADIRRVAIELDVELRVHEDGQVEALDFETRYALLRIAQESLVNAARHAPGSPVDLHISIDSALTRLTVRNLAFSDSDAAGAGSGIERMRTRAEQLGGTLSAQRDPLTESFELQVDLPHDRKDHTS